MKTKLILGLALAAGLLIGQPAFAHGKHGGGGGGRSHAVAAVHRSGGGGHTRVAASHFRGANHGTRVATVMRGDVRNFTTANRSRANGRRQTFAFGGNSYNAAARNGGGHPHGTFAFASHSGWSQDRQYFWHGHHYGWYGNGWYIIDVGPLYPYAAAYPYYYGPGVNAGSVAVQVQQSLAHDGYYQGPIDGVIGPGTSSAIAAYQQDNGLPVTGGIDRPLLHSMGM